MTRILPRLKLASVPPPIAPARCRQARFAFGEAHDPWRGLVGDVRAATVYAALCAGEIPFEIPPSQPSHTGHSEAIAPENRAALPEPILSRMSRPRIAARLLAASPFGR